MLSTFRTQNHQILESYQNFNLSRKAGRLSLSTFESDEGARDMNSGVRSEGDLQGADVIFRGFEIRGIFMGLR